MPLISEVVNYMSVTVTIDTEVTKYLYLCTINIFLMPVLHSFIVHDVVAQTDNFPGINICMG